MPDQDYPGAWPPPAPYYPPQGYGPPPQGYYPPPAPPPGPYGAYGGYGYPPPQQQQQQDMSGQLLGVLIPLMFTIPALRTGKVNINNMITALTNLPPLNPPSSPPTSQDITALQNYANTLRTQLLGSLNNDQTVFGQIGQGLMMQMLVGALGSGGMGGGFGGQNGLLMIVLVMALGGNFGV